MKGWLALPVLLLALALPGAARAWRVPLPDVPIEWHWGEPCPLLAPAVACAVGDGRVYVTFPNSDPLLTMLWHEVGHEYDWHGATQETRNAYRWAYGDNRRWAGPWPSAAEGFADAYARCAARDTWGVYGTAPDRPRRQFCRWLGRLVPQTAGSRFDARVARGYGGRPHAYGAGDRRDSRNLERQR